VPPIACLDSGDVMQPRCDQCDCGLDSDTRAGGRVGCRRHTVRRGTVRTLGSVTFFSKRLKFKILNCFPCGEQNNSSLKYNVAAKNKILISKIHPRTSVQKHGESNGRSDCTLIREVCQYHVALCLATKIHLV
jgi:hypothetical protein